jgi:hypothetical protein
MYKKLISSILVVALLNLVGCYSFQSVTVPEYKQVEEEEGKPNEIYVKTIDSQEYHFSDSDFYIKNDTLYGKEILFLSEEELPFEGKFAFGEIESIQLEDYGQKYPTTISQYQKIEAERGKPDEIYLTKYDSTKYHFMKNDYYIENDTLYGKGKLLLSDREQLFERKIALSDIVYFELDQINVITTAGLVIGILIAIGGLLVLISYLILESTKH